MAPLQKRAWLGLGVGVVISAAILAVMVTEGPTSFFEDDAMRWLVTGLGVALLVGWAVILSPVVRASVKGKTACDERDEAIIRRATYAQLWGIIGTMVAWAIALTEVYWDEGQIPIVFPYLIFWSLLMVNVLAQAMGILLGYRRLG
jgi:hypothetical protein